MASVNEIFDDPLAGFKVSEGSVMTVARSVTARITLFIGAAEWAQIFDKLCAQACDLPDYPEYFTNELLYEYRKAKGPDEAFEKFVLRLWVRRSIRLCGVDKSLDLLTAIIENRRARG